MLSLVVSFCSLLSAALAGGEPGDNNVNIVYLWFDDLGIGDVSFMGGDIPTPVLDALASRDVIKLNFHYTESLCTASRSSLMTGRYAWKSGINELAAFCSNLGFDAWLKLYPEILDSEMGYNNFIAGKWHIGYSSQSHLPFNRGFGQGLYTHWGPAYYDRFYQMRMAELDDAFGEPDESVRRKRDYLFGDGILRIHDTYKIHSNAFLGERGESPVFINDDGDSYCEDLYTDAVLQFIDEQDNAQQAFHIYYSLYTPHRINVEPPVVTPDGSQVSYAACETAFGGGDSCAESDRCLYCKQIHYASLRIEEIIHALQENDKIDWDNTVVVIASDNGPAEGYGSAIPLRGRKTAPFEGGIRTPALLLGGLVENIVRNNDALEDGLCQYNEMVHVSDWYHMFMEMNGVTADSNSVGYAPDSDHAYLNVWKHIQCQCGATSDSDKTLCDSLYTKRTELVSFRMCDDVSTDSDPYFFSSALIQDGYKLIVGGGNGALQECPFVLQQGDSNSAYISMDGKERLTPDAEYYEQWYATAKEGAAGGMGDTLYDSRCLNDLYANYQNGEDDNINQEEYAPFVFHDMLLYDLVTDKVEACAIADEERMARMYEYLKERSQEYSSPRQETTLSLAGFKAQLESYDCQAMYTVPWEDEIDDDSVDINEVWQNLIEYHHLNCLASHEQYSVVSHVLYLQNHSVVTIAMLSVLCTVAVFAMYRYCWQHREQYKGYTALPDHASKLKSQPLVK